MPTSVITRHLALDQDCIQRVISELIYGLILMENVCDVKDERARNIFYDIIFRDRVTTRHYSHFQLMWPHPRSRSSPFPKWWAALRVYIGQMFHKTCDQMKNWRWDNPRAAWNQVNRFNLQTTSSGKVK